MKTELPESYLSMAVAKDKVHTIHSFLERPVRIWSGQFDASDTQSSVLFSGTLPDLLLSDPMYNEKIRGFVGLRANVEVTVQINAQKFQQGRLRLQFLPYQKFLVDKYLRINSTLTGKTSTPGVDIDICGGSNPQSRVAQATLVVPYVSPHLYFNLITGAGTMGQINLFVYSPLVSGTSESTNCEVTIWARFLNPQLVFPTSATPSIAPATRRHFAQVRGEAKKLEKTGVVSDTLGKVAETLRTASKIPVIGSYMAIPEWVASTGEAICKLFGWSKPTMPMDTKLRTTNCMANYSGKDSSHKLALSADNEIDTPAGISGTNLDEMALSSVFKIPAFWQQFTWSSSDTVTDQILWRDPVTPFKYQSMAGTTNGIAMTPVGFISNVFGLWRGSLVYTFKIVKTGFHAGRLRVFFVPYGDAATLPIGAAPTNEIEKNYQVVVDIEESDTFSFRVPYVATKPWFNTQAVDSVGTSVQTFTGYVVVTVLNELRSVSTVSSSINILVEVSGGDDLTYALPRAPEFIPGIPFPVAERKHEAQVFGTAVEQPRNEAQLLYDPDAISSIDPVSNWSPEAHCIGEKVVSVRQLIKRSTFVGTLNETRSPTRGGDGGVDETRWTLGVINPYGFSIPDTETGIDYMSYFATIYTFFRGGIRIKACGVSLSADGFYDGSTDSVCSVTPRNNTLMFAKLLNSLDPLMARIKTYTTPVRSHNRIVGRIGVNNTQTDVSGKNNPIFTNANSASYVSQSIEGVLEMEVPYYNSSHITPCIGGESAPFFPTLQSDVEGAYPLPIMILGSSLYDRNYVIDRTLVSDPEARKTTLTPVSVNSYQIYRSAADDYSFSYIMGIPSFITINQPSGLTDIYKPTPVLDSPDT